MTQTPPVRRPPFWVVPVFAVLLLSPPGWATVGMVTVAVAALALPRLRAIAARSRADEQTDGTQIGMDRSGRAVVLSDREVSAHGLIVGASGAGKSTTLLAILTDRIRRGHPVVALDLKGSPWFARELHAAATAAGRPFRLWSLDGPTVWNPLQHGNATELKDKLIATERFTEPHYQRAAERYVQTALQTLHNAHPERPACLDEVVDVMEPRRLAALARSLPPDRSERLLDYLTSLTPDQLSAVRGLGTRLALVTESSAGPFLSPRSAAEKIDLPSALAGDEVVLFSLNSSSYGQLAAQIGTLVVQDLTTAAGERFKTGAPGGQAIVGIDEFSALGTENVLHLLARGREAGLPVLLATQELADLERAAPGLRDQVLGIVGLKIAHRQDVPRSAETIAQLAGTVRVWEETERISAGYLGRRYPTGTGTRRQVDRFLVDPNEIKSLRTGDAVLIAKTPRPRVSAVRIRPPRMVAPPTRVRPPARDGPGLG